MVLTKAFIISHTMFIVSDMQILNNHEPSSQDEIQTRHPHDGLRLLARLIARDILARRSVHAKKNDAKTDDTKATADS
jgi:hypothetical protein